MHGESVRGGEAERGHKLSPARRRLRAAARALALLCLAACVASWLAPIHWAFGLVRHFPMQLLAAASIAAGSAAVVRAWPWLGVAAVAVVHASLVMGLALGPAPARADPDAPTLRLVAANVHTAHPDPVAGARALAQLDADVLVAAEIDQRWQDALDEELAPLRRVVAVARNDNFGLAIYARDHVVARTEELALPGEIPAFRAEVHGPAGRFDLLAVHTLPPAGSHLAQLNEQHLAAIAEVAAKIRAGGQRVVVAGDLNATPWTAEFSALLERGALRNAARGQWSRRGTFPAPLWALPLRIPIDHVLVSNDVEVGTWRRGADLGSDHLPVVVHLR